MSAGGSPLFPPLLQQGSLLLCPPGIPSPKGWWGCGRRRCEPGLGVVLTPPPALHELGAGSCPPPGHKPVPAAPGTVAGTPGRLPRPPAHTHPRALACFGPFRLSRPPGAPPPPPCWGAPTPVLCSRGPLCSRQPVALAPFRARAQRLDC